MNREDDPLAETFAQLRRSGLDPAFAARVQARARATLVPARRASRPVRLVLASLVPALLLSAALYRALETVELAATIYARRARQRPGASPLSQPIPSGSGGVHARNQVRNVSSC